MENIQYYPVQYTSTQPMLDFFTIITNDLALQDRLYHSETLSDVSRIAKEYGFDIPAADIQKAQAGRVLGIINEKNERDIQALLNGEKPRTGAQWGRGGQGYLDRPGYWFLALHESHNTPCDQPQIVMLLDQLAINSTLRNQLQETITVNEVIDILSKHNIIINPIEWLAYYAQCIVQADDKLANQMTLKIQS